QCGDARRAVERLRAGGDSLVVVPQNLYEFWAVATRRAGAPPAGQNGLGMTLEQASAWLRVFQKRLTLLSDRAALLDCWHALVIKCGIRGLRSYDARLVAEMQTYGIAQLLTFNGGDFKAFGIKVIDPMSV